MDIIDEVIDNDSADVVEDDSLASSYAEPGTEEDFLVKREAWKRGELDFDDLPQGAVSIDGLGRTIVFGKYYAQSTSPAFVGRKSTPESMGVNISPKWKPTVSKPLPCVRCVTIKRDGNRCGRWSIRGATVCLVHGGRLKNVRQHAAAAVDAARMRLIDLSDDAVSVLSELTSSETAPAIRLKAATEILDRAGIKGGMDIDVVVEHKIDASKTIADKLGEIVARSQAKEIEDEDIIDAEVLEDSE